RPNLPPHPHHLGRDLAQHLPALESFPGIVLAVDRRLFAVQRDRNVAAAHQREPDLRCRDDGGGFFHHASSFSQAAGANSNTARTTAVLKASRTARLSKSKQSAYLILPRSSRSAMPSLLSMAGDGRDAHCLPLLDRISTPRAVMRNCSK